MYLALTLESDKIRKDTVCSLNRISEELGLEHRKVIAQKMGMLLYSELNKLAAADNIDKFSQCDRHITVDFLKSPGFIIQRFGEIIIHRFCPNPISHSEYKKAILVELEKWEKIGRGDQTVMNIFLDLLGKIVSEVENKFLI